MIQLTLLQQKIKAISDGINQGFKKGHINMRAYIDLEDNSIKFKNI